MRQLILSMNRRLYSELEQTDNKYTSMRRGPEISVLSHPEFKKKYWCITCYYLPGTLRHWLLIATLQPEWSWPPFNAIPLFISCVLPPFNATPPPLASLPAPTAVNESFKLKFHLTDGKEICEVIVSAASEPVVIYDEAGKQQEFYVRVGNSSKPYTRDEFYEYYKRRFK